MTQNLGQATLNIGVTTDVDKVMAQAKQSIKDFSVQAVAAGNEINKGMHQVDGATAAVTQTTDKLSKQQQRLAERIERSAKRASMTTAQYLEWDAKTKGVYNQVKPLIDALHQMEAAKEQSISSSRKLLDSYRQQAETIGLTKKQLEEYKAAQAGILKDAQPFIDRKFQVEQEMEAAKAKEQQAAASKKFSDALEQERLALTLNEKEMQEYRAAQLGIRDAMQPEIDRIADIKAMREQAKAQAQATAAGEQFISMLKEEAATIGMTRKELMEYQATKLNVRDQAQPLIDAQFDTSGAFRATEMSVKQTRQAMRLLPAQITDIVTSLASGMPIYLVAIQQGGQLRDSFGGLGNMLKGVRALINPTMLALGGLGATAGLVALAYYKASNATDELNRSLIETGNAAGLTMGQLYQLRDSYSEVTGSTLGASSALAEIVKSGKLSSDQFETIGKSAVQWAKITGQEVGTVIDMFTSLRDDPMDAAMDLQRQYNFLTVEVYKQVEALLEQGRQTEAVNVLMKQLAGTFDARAPQMIESTNGLAKAWNLVKNAITGAMNAAVGLFDAPTQEALVATMETQVAYLRKILVERKLAGMAYGKEAAAYEAAERGLAEQKAKLISIQQQSTSANKEEVETISNLDKLNQYYNKTLTDQEQYARAAAAAISEGMSLVSKFAPGTAEAAKATEAMNRSLAKLQEEFFGEKKSGGGGTSRKVKEDLDESYYMYEEFINNVTGRMDEARRQQEEAWLYHAITVGDITAKEFEDAINKINGLKEDELNQMNEFVLEAARNIQKALGDTLYDVLKGNFDNIGQSFGDMLLKMAADAAAANLATAMFGNYGKTGEIGGLLGQIGSAIVGSFGGAANAVSMSDSGASMMGTGSTAGGFGATAYPVKMAEGGYTGPGPKHQPAGIVHRGEVVFSQNDISRSGGLARVESMRKGYADGGVVGGMAAGTASAPVVNVTNRGTPQQVESAQATFDGSKWVLSVVMNDIRNNGALGQLMRRNGAMA